MSKGGGAAAARCMRLQALEDERARARTTPRRAPELGWPRAPCCSRCCSPGGVDERRRASSAPASGRQSAGPTSASRRGCHRRRGTGETDDVAVPVVPSSQPHSTTRKPGRGRSRRPQGCSPPAAPSAPPIHSRRQGSRGASPHAHPFQRRVAERCADVQHARVAQTRVAQTRAEGRLIADKGGQRRHRQAGGEGAHARRDGREQERASKRARGRRVRARATGQGAVHRRARTSSSEGAR